MTIIAKNIKQKEIILNNCNNLVINIAAPYCNRNTKYQTDDEKSNTIKRIVCEYYGITTSMIEYRCRKREFVEPRQVATTLTRKFTNLSLKQTGLRYGGIDHSTVLHNKDAVRDLIDTNKAFSDKFNAIKSRIELELRA
jgi:chromosomal replication initiator protein